MVNKGLKYFFISFVLNVIFLFACFFFLYAYDEGQISMSWFVKFNEYLMNIYRFPLRLNKVGGDNYWRDMIINQIIISVILAVLVLVCKKLVMFSKGK